VPGFRPAYLVALPQAARREPRAASLKPSFLPISSNSNETVNFGSLSERLTQQMPAPAGETGGDGHVLDLARREAAACADDFNLGDWFVQPGLNRVSSDGKSIHLRPQLMDVLVCLARRPGGTVHRSELLDQVWPGQFVAETALARCVAELRQALGDRAHQPVIIETIPKRGYRLIAPVTPAEARVSALPPAPARIYTFPPHVDGETERLLAPAVTPPAVADAGGSVGGAAALAVPGAGPGALRHWGRGLALLGMAGIMAVAASLWFGRAGGFTPAPIAKGGVVTLAPANRAAASSPSVPLVRAGSPSAGALHALNMGDLERERGQFAQALASYREAASLDQGFALAHARLGATYLTLQRRTDAERPLRRAYELRDRTALGDRLYITGLYFSAVMRDPLHALDAFAAWSQSSPGSVDAHVHLAGVYRQLGLWTLANDEAAAALRLAPDHVQASLALAGALAGAGRYEEASNILAGLSRRGVVTAEGRALRFDIAYATRDVATMTEEDAAARRDPAMAALLSIRRARKAMVEGRFRDSSVLWAGVRAEAAARGDLDTVSESWLAEAASRALLGERVSVAQHVGQALADVRTPSRLAQAALVLALSGRAADASRYLAEYDRLAGLDSGRDPEFVKPAQAAVAFVEKRFADVAAILEPIVPYEMGPRFECLPAFIRAHGLMGLGRADEARREFAAIVEHRGTAPLSFIRPLAYLGLGRAHATLGQLADSRRAYEEFFRLWANADQDLTLLTAARTEFAKLPQA
jgi:DNA-binding winged helix-turn-helix (wHTH) protein/tetratricopeptide (TPR) repeat protein